MLHNLIDRKAFLPDSIWEKIEPHIPKVKKGHGRPRVSDREIATALMYKSKTGSSLRQLTFVGFPPFQTINRRMEEWRNNGVLEILIRSNKVPGSTLPEFELAPHFFPRKGEKPELPDF